MTAGERARAGLPKEAQPGAELRAVHLDASRRFDPYAQLSARDLQHIYGDHQLGAALNGYSRASLAQAARDVQAEHPGTKPTDARSKSSLVSYMTRTLTNGKYSADFAKPAPAKATAAARAPRTAGQEARAPRTAGQEARRAANAQKRADQATARETPLTVVAPPGHGLARPFNPYSQLDARFTRALYGDKQLQTALAGYSVKSLRAAARGLGITQPGRSRAETAKRIAEKLRSNESYATSLQRAEHASAAMRAEASTQGVGNLSRRPIEDYYR
jgi:hypothetical protein